MWQLGRPGRQVSDPFPGRHRAQVVSLPLAFGARAGERCGSHIREGPPDLDLDLDLAATCSEHTEPSAESSSLQSPCKEQPGISCLKNRRQASTSHLLLAEVQFRVGSEGPGSVSTGASLPWPCCPGLGGAYGEVPSRDPRRSHAPRGGDDPFERLPYQLSMVVAVFLFSL